MRVHGRRDPHAVGVVDAQPAVTVTRGDVNTSGTHLAWVEGEGGVGGGGGSGREERRVYHCRKVPSEYFLKSLL